jgi:hypothetical protein
MERDEQIIELVGVMNDAYAFMDEAEPLQHVGLHRILLERLVQQTIECGYFISSYSKDLQFGM